MAGTVENIVVGLAGENTVKIGAYAAVEGDAVDVGFTEGGVTIEKSCETKEIEVDQVVGPVDSVRTKESWIIKFSMAEISLANLALAMGYPTTAVAGSTLSAGGPAADITARTMYINVKGPGPGTGKWTFWKVKPTGKTSAPYKKADKTVIDVEFQALVDTTKTAEQQVMQYVATGVDSTPPTVALSTPTDGGTVTKDAKGTVVWTITEANPINENTIVYGNTFSIINTTTPGSAALVAGTIAYSATAKTVTFTPSANWTASDTFQAVVTTGLKDIAGNALAAMKIEQFSVSS